MISSSLSRRLPVLRCLSSPLPVPVSPSVRLFSAATPSPSSSASPSTSPSSVPPPLNFNDSSSAFAQKTDAEILRAYLVFKLCSCQPMVKRAKYLINLSNAVLGKSLTACLLKQTFFGHFCAGETADSIQPAIQRLDRAGIGSILDYAAEADVPQPRDRTGIVSSRTYDYEGEASCDANARVCEEGIETAGRRPNGFAAIKLTALGKPELLEHISKVLVATKRLFQQFAEEAIIQESKGVQVSMRKTISFDQFHHGLKAINVNLGEERARKLFQKMNANGSGQVDYLEWIHFLDPRQLGGLNPKFRSEGLPTLSDEELKQYDAMIARLERIAHLASDKGVKLMVDAEQTYFQPAIDHLVLHLQRKYNRQSPVIFTTYQCYLKDTMSRLEIDLERAKREGFYLAAKCVRGAYMIQERKRASDMGYEDPIQPNIESTHANYHNVVEKLMQNISRCSVMVASHNEKSVQFVVEKMRELGIPTRGGVYFGQLLGMCDHISYSLGMAGYQVFKYVPYGPVHEVIPYLVRRAEENGDMLGGAKKELSILTDVIIQRLEAKSGGKAKVI